MRFSVPFQLVLELKEFGIRFQIGISFLQHQQTAQRTCQLIVRLNLPGAVTTCCAA